MITRMMNRIEQFRQSFTRKTEKTDTRQAIQRHDPDYFKKKKDDGEDGGFKDPYDDLANVSVHALVTFLEGLLDRDGYSHGGDAQTAENPDGGADIRETRPPASPQTAAAMNAYQARAGGNARKPPPLPKENENAAPQTALDKAAAELDPNALKAVIRDLRGLTARGIGEIALERGDGFLESIRASVEKHKL